MSNDVCSKCRKPAYPMEKLSFLDRTWHKSCFSCTQCQCHLNLKDAKGYNREPYCTTHYPKIKATAIPETPRLFSAPKSQNDVSNIQNKDTKNTWTEAAKTNPIQATTTVVTGTNALAQPQVERQTGNATAPVPEAQSVVASGVTTRTSPPAVIRKISEKKALSTDSASFVRQLPKRSSSLATYTQEEGYPRYVCINDFEPNAEDEIRVTKGDIVFVEKVHDDGWALAYCLTSGNKGLIPFNYLEKS